MLSRLFRRSISQLCYVILVLITTLFVAISCALLLSQAARTAPNRSFVKNVDAVIIGASYVAVVRPVLPHVWTSAEAVVTHVLQCILCDVWTAHPVLGVVLETEDRGA